MELALRANQGLVLRRADLRVDLFSPDRPPSRAMALQNSERCRSHSTGDPRSQRCFAGGQKTLQARQRREGLSQAPEIPRGQITDPGIGYGRRQKVNCQATATVRTNASIHGCRLPAPGARFAGDVFHCLEKRPSILSRDAGPAGFVRREESKR
jgi:hypothetical protein